MYMDDQRFQASASDIYEDGLSTAEMLYYEVASLDNHIPLYTATISQTPPVIVASENKSYAGPFEKLRSNRRIRTKKSNNDDSKETVDAMHTCYDYSKSIVPDSMDWFSTVHQVYYEHARNDGEDMLYQMVSPEEWFEDYEAGDSKVSRRSKKRKRDRERNRNRKTSQQSETSSVSPNPHFEESKVDRISPAKQETKALLKKGPDKKWTNEKSAKENSKKSPLSNVDGKAIKKSSATHEPAGKTPPVAAKKPTPEPKQSDKIMKTHAQVKAAGIAYKRDAESQETLEDLEKELIYPLKKKSLKFPRARYFCRLCEYHMDDFGHANRHLKDNRHRNGKKSKVRDLMLACLPDPCKVHHEAITQLLKGVMKKNALTKENVQSREKVVNYLQKNVLKERKDVTLRLYGSSVNGFGLNSSDINIELKAEKAPMVLKEMFCILKDGKFDKNIENVRSNFSAIVPSILYQCPNIGGCTVRIGVTSSGIALSGSSLSSALLKTYCMIDQRVRQIGVPFRLWAKFCGIDDQESGTLPSYAFGMMTIFFLQQCKPPVLPVLHQVGSPADRKAGAPDNNYFDDIDDLDRVWKCKNTESVGELWVKMCRFYALDIDMREIIVCIRSKQFINRGEKKWTKRLAIEDPFQRKRNISRSISHSQMFDYIYDQLRNLYQYFGIPQLSHGPLFKDIDNTTLEDQLVKIYRARDRSPQKPAPNTNLFSTERSQEDISNGSSTSKKVQKSPSQELLGDSEEEDERPNGQNIESFASSIVTSAFTDALQQCDYVEKKLAGIYVDEKCVTPPTCMQSSSRLPLFDESVLDGLTSESLRFKFTLAVLCSESAPKICALCHKHGHLQQTCPDVQLPALKPLPPLSKRYRVLVDEIIAKVPIDFQPTEGEIRVRDDVVKMLESYIRVIYKDARLNLFGSSCNGFGFSHSDMDICMVLKETESVSVDYVDTIRILARHLRKHQRLTNVVPITTAKVPIVKFRDRHSGLEGDISLYNTLAVHNTHMLSLYSNLDYRVQALGYTMKVFAKLCDICDASKGSLSSYAYILMVIYFLQQRNPPVIPVLQELHTGNQSEVIVDGWNAWFNSDIQSIRKLWKQPVKNTESLGELWIGLLRFYTEEFNFKDYVISIRQRTLLTRFEKLWNGKCVAIEDPFDLSHNLGGGLSRRMDTYIMKAFHNGRTLFGTSVDSMPPGYMTLEDYLFDPKLLTDTAPPNDRNCRSCGRIGHFARECPRIIGKHGESNKNRNSEETATGSSKNASKARGQTPVKNGGVAIREGGDNQLNISKNAGAAGHGKQKSRPDKTKENSVKSNPERNSSPSIHRRENELHSPSAHRQHGSAQHNKPQTHSKVTSRVFYNKQKGTPSDTRSATPRAMYINHSPQQSFHQQQSPVQPLMSINPVQQLFNNYNTGSVVLPNQNLPPMPLMAVHVESPLQFQHQQYMPVNRYNPSRSVQISPPHGGSSLTWQQQQLLQHQQQSNQTNRRSPRKQPANKEMSIEEEFPNLEITIPNKQLTWQQQHIGGESQDQNKRKRKAPNHQDAASPRK